MANDKFFTQQHCDRCHKELGARTTSWFTTECLCIDCSNQETALKDALRRKGRPAVEGCGYLPKLEEEGEKRDE
jgi:hypothetical protein